MEKPILVKHIKSVSELTDSTYLVDVHQLESSKNSFFVADRYLNQLFKLSETLAFENTYGVAGSGPHELEEMATFHVSEDSIYVFNAGKMNFEVYSVHNPKFSRTLEYPLSYIGDAVENRFTLQSDTMIFALSGLLQPITLMTKDTLFQGSFGEVYEFNSIKQTLIRNNRTILLFNDKLIAISDNVPIFEIYDPSAGELISKKDVSKVSAVKERLSFIERQPKEDNSYYHLFRDAYLVGNTLYVLCITGSEGPVANTVLIWEIKDNFEFVYKQNIVLPGEWYTSICVNDNSLLAYETVLDELQLFALEK